MAKRGKTRARRHKKEWEPSPQQLEIYAKVCEGRGTHAQIATEHDVTRSRITQIVKEVDDWLWPQMFDAIREVKTRQTNQLLHIFREAMQAWERSKLNAEREVIKEIIAQDKEPKPGERKETKEIKVLAVAERTKTTSGQCGDPRFLAEARNALEDIRKIWGADAPVKVEHSGELRVAGMTAEEANRQLVEQLGEAQKRLLEPSVN